MSSMHAATAAPTSTRPPGIALPGILLGIGLGGFLDGILLHQILQWHHMLSSSPRPTSRSVTTRSTRSTAWR
ncbi:DUF2243 domain-containing protein [Mariniluteicoccus endophyticus]